MKRFFLIRQGSAALLMPLLLSSLLYVSNAQNAPVPEESAEGHVTNTRVTTAAWFEPERYTLADLSPAGQQALQQFAEALLSGKAVFANQSPGLEVEATVSILCSSRQPAFQRPSALLDELNAKQIQLPANDPERRQALNLYLSSLRAETLSAMLRELLTPHDRADPFLKIKYRPKGQGETPLSETASASNSPAYVLSVEFAFKERGPRVSRPTETILYEIIEDENE